MISVCVITYNQEQYIKKCLDSIVEQELDCQFELLIRDDASHDRTPIIIEEYAKKYPTLIRVLPGEENVGANVNLLTIFSACQGEFIAICEGDDYWTDKNKLQKQLNTAKKFKDIEFFTHPASVGGDDDTVNKIWPCQAPTFFNVNDILRGLGQFAPTSSYFFSKKALVALPIWFGKAPIGDFFIELYLTGMKKGYSLDEVMSNYRTSSTGSWVDTISRDQTGEKGVRAFRMIKIYLKKASLDFPEHKPAFLKRLEYVDFAIAHQFMKSGNYSNFLRYINKAGEGIGDIGLSAKILFTFRYVKIVILGLYKIKKSFLYAQTIFQSWR